MRNINYGKIVDEQLEYANNPLWIDDKMIANPTAEIYIQHGYKPIKHSEPQQKEGYYFTSNYKDEGDYILEFWEEHIVETNIITE